MEPTMFVPPTGTLSAAPGAFTAPVDPEDETLVSPPAAFTFNSASANPSLLPSEKAVETLFAALSPLRQYTPYYFGVFDSPLRPSFSLGDLEAPLLNINRRYHQSNRRSLNPSFGRNNSHVIASQNAPDLPPFKPPASLSAASLTGGLPSDSDIRKGLLDIVNEFESLEEDEEGPLETGSAASSLDNDSEVDQSQDSEIAAAAATAAAASAAALSRSKRSKRKKDFDMSAADIVQNMPILQPGSALLGGSDAFGPQPRAVPSPGSVVKQLMNSAAEIPNPTPGAAASRANASRVGTSGANIAAAAKNALTQRLIDMVKKTATQQGAGPVQVVADATSTFEDQGRTSSRGRKRKAKATTSVDGDEDQLSFEQDDDLISVQPTGAIVVRHHYIPVQSDGTTIKGTGNSPKVQTRVVTEDPRFEELDEDTEDEEDDNYEYSDATNPTKVVPRVAPAAGVVAPGSALAKGAGSPTMGAPQAAAKRQHPGVSATRMPPVVASAAALVSGANGKAGASSLPAPTAKVSGAARKSTGFRAGAGHTTHHHHHSAAHQHAAHLASQLDDSIWNVEETEERKRVKEFWLSLTPDARAGLIKLEKDAVLRKMKEQQKHTCTCSVCGRRRTAIEEELEMLYDAYYDELERYTERQTEPGGFSFFKNLGAKGGMLSVANDLMKNEGKKFLEMMERLADRRLKTASTPSSADQQHPGSSASTDASEDSFDDDAAASQQQAVEPHGGHSTVGDDQRLEEGKRMFQMFAAKMFEQRILAAYREKVAYEKQQKLIEEEEEKERQAAMKKDSQKKKREAKKAKRKQKAEEEARAEREKKEREDKEKEEKARIEREKREEAKKLKQREEEEKRRLQEEEDRKRREKERKEAEEREKKRKEKEEAERREREKAQREKDAKAKQAALKAAKEQEAAQAAQAAAAAAAAAQAAAQEALEDQNSGEADEDDELPSESGNSNAAKKRKKRQRNKNKKGSGDKADVYIPGMVKPGTVQHVSSVAPQQPATVPVGGEPKQPQILKKRPADAEPAPDAQLQAQQKSRKWRERNQQQEKQPQFQILEKPAKAQQPTPQPVKPVAPNPNAPAFTPPARAKVPVTPNPAAAVYTPPAYSPYTPTPTTAPAATSTQPAASTATSSSHYYPPRPATATTATNSDSQLPRRTSTTSGSTMGNIDLGSVANLLPSTLLPALDATPAPPQDVSRNLWSSPAVNRPTASPKTEGRRSVVQLEDNDEQLPPAAKSLLSSLLDPDDEIVAPVRRTGAVVSPKIPAAKPPSQDLGWGAPSLPTGLLNPIGSDQLNPLMGSGLGSVIGSGAPPGLKSMFIDNDLTSFYRGSVVDSSIWGASPQPAPELLSPRSLAPGFGTAPSAPIGANKAPGGK